MSFLPLLRAIEQLPSLRVWQQAWTEGLPVQIYGSCRSFTAAAAAALWRIRRRSLFWVTESLPQSEGVREDLETLLATQHEAAPVLLFEPLESLLYQDVALDRGAVAARLKVLDALHRGRQVVILCPVHALLQPTLPPQIFGTGGQRLEVGQQIAPEQVVSACRRLGYHQTLLVSQPGEFAVRGGLLDVYPPTTELPVRIEFFGDEIDSIRSFDPTTQRSSGRLSWCELAGSRELRLDPYTVEAALPRIRIALQEQIRQLTDQGLKATARRLLQRVEDDLRRLVAGEYFEGVERYLSFLYPTGSTILDHLGPQVDLLLSDLRALRQAADTWLRQIEAAYQHRLERGWGLLQPPAGIVLKWDLEALPWNQHPRAEIVEERAAPQPADKRPATISIDFGVEPLQGVDVRDLDGLRRLLQDHRQQGWGVLFTTHQQARLQQLLRTWELTGLSSPGPDGLPAQGGLVLCPERLSAGFRWPERKLVVLTDAEAFGSPLRRRSHRRLSAPTADLLSPLELKAGDYVVHEVYGIGHYQGLTQRAVGGVERDYLVIAYHNQDRLYLPVEQMSRIQRYLGPDGHQPRLDSLTGTRWRKAKQRTQEALLALARELMEMEARRKAGQGHAYAADSEWQREVEAAFLYQETPSQTRAIAEVKRDLEAVRPMDRIICGDVGFGKTEIALRAAFKVCMDGKQVVVLAPTTVLAQQHYNTFRERLGAYPLRIELLSRFRSPQQQTAVVEGLRAGTVDIVVGTHRLLQPDVTFKDLGLLIVDEEQRFGVRQKELLKRLRATVDVLTLTATPIPRTLQNALIGVRDLSIVLDPPTGRLPVETYVVPKEDGLVREAILRELNRGGQVFYVHPRIRPLKRIAAWLQELVPSARVAIAHGQLAEDELETVMFDFFAQRYDVLLCTTIIENGLDVPNANTLLIEDCERFGLAQLYQLRGRVGRSDRQAYAFLLYEPHRQLTASAQARLEAIREFSDLGSGLRLALRDLEIRGAGNLLGAEQHGFIAEVGFDLYCQMLEETIRRLQGGAADQTPSESERPTTEVDLPVSAYLPESYVADLGMRMDFYRRLMIANTPAAVEAIQEELADRFGRTPLPASNLIRIARLRALAMVTGVRRLRIHDGDLVAEFMAEAAPPPSELRSLARRLQALGGQRGSWRMRLSCERLRAPLRATTPAQILRDGEELLYRWQTARSAPEEGADTREEVHAARGAPF